MKPLLVLGLPQSLSTSIDGKSNYVKIIKMLRNKLLPNYEVIIAPWGVDTGIEIKTEGMVNLVIGENTNFDELFKELDRIAELKTTISDFKEIGKEHPDVITDTMTTIGIPNKNRTVYLSDNIIGNIPDTNDQIIAPTIEHIDIKVTCMKARNKNGMPKEVSEMIANGIPVLWDPFDEMKKKKEESDNVAPND